MSISTAHPLAGNESRWESELGDNSFGYIPYVAVIFFLVGVDQEIARLPGLVLVAGGPEVFRQQQGRLIGLDFLPALRFLGRLPLLFGLFRLCLLRLLGGLSLSLLLLLLFLFLFLSFLLFPLICFFLCPLICFFLCPLVCLFL